jgi:hypothetical protein
MIVEKKRPLGLNQSCVTDLEKGVGLCEKLGMVKLLKRLSVAAVDHAVSSSSVDTSCLGHVQKHGTRDRTS